MAHSEFLLLGSHKRLATVDALYDEHVIDFLKGLCICSCPNFKEMFQVMLQMTKLGNSSVLNTILSNWTPTEMIEAILTKAVGLYDMLSNVSKWNTQNCG